MSQQPLDADAVLRDDALLDALGRGEMLPEFGDDHTARLLLAWRDDIADTAGLPDVAASPVRSIGTARVPTGPVAEPRRFRLSRRVTVAAAFAAFAVGSIGSVAAAATAEPGSPLWPITKVVYEDRAKSLEAREGALSLLREARDAAEHNNPDQARRLLASALQEAGDVSDESDKDRIQEQADKVVAQLAAMDPTDPAVPTSPPGSAPVTSPTPVPEPTPSTEPTTAPNPSPSTPGDPGPSPAETPTPDSSPPPSPEPSVGMAPDSTNVSPG